MANYPRYAIYYTAAPGSALDQFGASLLGYDAYGGDEQPFPHIGCHAHVWPPDARTDHPARQAQPPFPHINSWSAQSFA